MNQDLLEIHQNFDDKKYQIHQDQKYKMTRMQRIYKIKIYDTRIYGSRHTQHKENMNARILITFWQIRLEY